MAAKVWDVIQVLASDEKLMRKALLQGWEPYAVVAVPGAGIVYYLRIFR